MRDVELDRRVLGLRVVEREHVVDNITLERVRELARRYVDPARLVFLVVGDAHTQLPRLSAAGLGRPILIDIR